MATLRILGRLAIFADNLHHIHWQQHYQESSNQLRFLLSLLSQTHGAMGTTSQESKCSKYELQLQKKRDCRSPTDTRHVCACWVDEAIRRLWCGTVLTLTSCKVGPDRSLHTSINHHGLFDNPHRNPKSSGLPGHDQAMERGVKFSLWTHETTSCTKANIPV